MNNQKVKEPVSITQAAKEQLEKQMADTAKAGLSVRLYVEGFG